MKKILRNFSIPCNNNSMIVLFTKSLKQLFFCLDIINPFSATIVMRNGKTVFFPFLMNMALLAASSGAWGCRGWSPLPYIHVVRAHRK